MKWLFLFILLSILFIAETRVWAAPNCKAILSISDLETAAHIARLRTAIENSTAIPRLIEHRIALLNAFEKYGGQIKIDSDFKKRIVFINHLSTPVLYFRSYDDMNRAAGGAIEQLSDWSNNQDNLLHAQQLLTQAPPETRELLYIHKLFADTGGVLEIRPYDLVRDGKTKSAYFMTPSSAVEPPKIVLRSDAQVINGTYKHELDHFRRWYQIKQKLIAQGFSDHRAHLAMHKYNKSSNLAAARMTQFLEDSATYDEGSYGQFEAIRRLDLKRINDLNSAEGRQALSYAKEGLEKEAELLVDTYAFNDKNKALIGGLKFISTIQDKGLRERAQLSLIRLQYQNDSWYLQMKLRSNILKNNMFTSYLIERVTKDDERQELQTFINTKLDNLLKSAALYAKNNFKYRSVEALRNLKISEDIIVSATKDIDYTLPLTMFLEAASSAETSRLQFKNMAEAVEEAAVNNYATYFLTFTREVPTNSEPLDRPKYNVAIRGEDVALYFMVDQQTNDLATLKHFYRQWRNALIYELEIHGELDLDIFRDQLGDQSATYFALLKTFSGIKAFLKSWADHEAIEYDKVVAEELHRRGLTRSEIESVISNK